MARRNRRRQRARKAPFKDPKPVILVVTEGAVTEKEYLDGLTEACRNPRVRIEIKPGAGVPKTVVQYARELKTEKEKQAKRENDDNLIYDEVWCVFDVDEHPNIPEAKQTARDNGLELAISNPCIELWLWLHFAEQPGMQDRKKLQKMMKKHIPKYNKHVNYVDYDDGYDDAHRRAKRLDQDAKKQKDEGRNPTTGVWRLTASIRAGA